jgi:hypothetical protein
MLALGRHSLSNHKYFVGAQFDSWAFTAGIYINYWRDPSSSTGTGEHKEAGGSTTSWGYVLADKVLHGAMKAFFSNAQQTCVGEQEAR